LSTLEIGRLKLLLKRVKLELLEEVAREFLEAS
jgi:hypothetical protein